MIIMTRDYVSDTDRLWKSKEESINITSTSILVSKSAWNKVASY